MLYSKAISWGIPIFSISGNQVAHLAMQCDIKFRQKYKMAAIQTGNGYTSTDKIPEEFLASKTDRNEITTAIPMFSGFRNTVVISRLVDARCNRKSKIQDGGR